VRGLTYLRYEILRTLRARRFLIFSLGFPLVLFYTVAGAHRSAHIDGIGFPLYYMTGMLSWGTMMSVVSSGGRIAQERSVGWTRQMRVTPLTTRSYFTAKVLSSYLLALLTVLIMGLAGTSLGVRLAAHEWLTMLAQVLVGLIPFAILGIMLGHLLSVDSLGPALGGGTSVLALLGGAYGPLASGGAFLAIVKCLPSYWLVQASKSAIGSSGWPPTEAWIVIGAWTVVLAVLAARVYQRDTQRV
jgi:ABC-2 type transport system permease protein